MYRAKILIVAICFCMMSMFTGCDLLTQNIESLLVPPKLTEEQSDIDHALKLSVGSKINLVYPETGDYRSAYVVENIDEEESKEAIVFYKDSNESTSSVRVNILDNKDGNWVSTYDESSVIANGVEKLSFINVDNKTYLVVGFNISGSNEKNLVVYDYYDNKLNQVFAGRCADYEVYDINADGELEVVMIVNTMVLETQKETVAKMYSFNNSKFELLSETYMDSGTSTYVGIFKGYVEENKPALFFDGQKGTDSVATEIIVADDDIIKNLSYSKEVNLMQNRINGISCMDLNGDGIYDVPQTLKFPGYEASEDTQIFYMTEWYNYIDEKMVRINTTYTEADLGYYFIMPEKWLDLGKVTAKRDVLNNEIVFYLFNGDISAVDEELLRIKVFSKSQIDEAFLPLGYTFADDSGQLIYAYKIGKTNTEYDITSDEFFEMFNVIK